MASVAQDPSIPPAFREHRVVVEREGGGLKISNMTLFIYECPLGESLNFKGCYLLYALK